MIFTSIERVELPNIAVVSEGFTVVMVANGEVPFAQLILRHADGWEWIIKENRVSYEGNGRYRFHIPAEAYHADTAYLQVEGCRVVDIGVATPSDWVTAYCEIQIVKVRPLQ